MRTEGDIGGDLECGWAGLKALSHKNMAIRYIDLVIPETCWEQKIEDVKKYHIDCFVIGDDWEGKFDFLKEYCEVVYLARTPEISTTRIKNHFNLS